MREQPPAIFARLAVEYRDVRSVDYRYAVGVFVAAIRVVLELYNVTLDNRLRGGGQLLEMLGFHFQQSGAVLLAWALASPSEIEVYCADALSVHCLGNTALVSGKGLFHCPLPTCDKAVVIFDETTMPA